jgi:hypothetical protein
MHHELGKSGVEAGILKRQPLRGRPLDLDFGEACLSRADKRFGRVDCRHGTRAQTLYERRRERPGPAADIQRTLPVRDAGERHEQCRQRPGIAADESVVGVRVDVKAHAKTLSPWRRTSHPSG